ncbi:hypothetical protein [Nocardia nepalensis]|uniref:hypothetical protein n=1 Tax=Nocardia nepalensis TaxID=3375448 RepID=UPI003B677DA1
MVVIVGGLLAFGYHRFEVWRDRPSEARRIAEAATVAGFVRTAVVDASDGDNPPYANAYFIRPAPKPDPLEVVVPTIQLSAVAPLPAPEPWEKPRIYDVVAKGKRPDGCEASVTVVSDPKPTVRDIRGEHSISILTPEQLDEVRKGTKVFIQLTVVNCGW